MAITSQPFAWLVVLQDFISSIITLVTIGQIPSNCCNTITAASFRLTGKISDVDLNTP